MIDVTAHGVLPGRNASEAKDCLPALKILLATLRSSKQALLYFPAGAYRLAGTLDLSGFPNVRIVGDGMCGWAGGNPPTPLGTILFGNVAGDLIRHSAPGTVSLHTYVADVAIENPGGTGLHIEGSYPTVERARISAGAVGLDMRSNCFDPRILGCQFTGPGKWTPDNIALLLCKLTNAKVEAYFAGWTEGVRTSGVGLRLANSRFEHNLYAIRLGMSVADGKELLTGSVLSRLDFEANGTSVDVANADNCLCEVLGILGHIASPPTPTTQATCGIDDHGSNNVEWRQVNLHGAFSKAGIVVNQQGGNATPQTASWHRAESTNTLGPPWLIDSKAKPHTKFSESNQPA